MEIRTHLAFISKRGLWSASPLSRGLRKDLSRRGVRQMVSDFAVRSKWTRQWTPLCGRDHYPRKTWFHFLVVLIEKAAFNRSVLQDDWPSLQVASGYWLVGTIRITFALVSVSKIMKGHNNLNDGKRVDLVAIEGNSKNGYLNFEVYVEVFHSLAKKEMISLEEINSEIHFLSLRKNFLFKTY